MMETIEFITVYPKGEDENDEFDFQLVPQQMEIGQITEDLLFPNSRIPKGAMSGCHAHFILRKADGAQLTVCPLKQKCAIHVHMMGRLGGWMRNSRPNDNATLFFYLEETHDTEFEPDEILDRRSAWKFIEQWLSTGPLAVNCNGTQSDAHSRKIIHATSEWDIFTRWRNAFYPMTVQVGGEEVLKIQSPLDVEVDCKTLRERHARDSSTEFRFVDTAGTVVQLTTFQESAELTVIMQTDGRRWGILQPDSNGQFGNTPLSRELGWELCEEWLINGETPMAV